MRSSCSKWWGYRKKRNGLDGNDGLDLADTRLALIVLVLVLVLVLSAAVLVIVIERFACMALPNSCPRNALNGME